MSSLNPEALGSTAFTPSLTDLVARVAGAGENPTIVIDGPSGAGKSTVADFLVRHVTSVQLVRLDDIYPGWEGLEEASAVAERLLLARSRGEFASWQRYDWASASLSTWHDVDPLRPLVIEGCGALSAQAQESAQLRVWVTVNESIRRERALSRGGEDFEAHWESWDVQFVARIRRENPERFANIVLAAS